MKEAAYGRASRWLTVATVDPRFSKVSRDDIINALEAENIEARPVWKPMQLQPLYRGSSYYQWVQEGQKQDQRQDQGQKQGQQQKQQQEEGGGSFSEKLCNEGLCLPSGTNMTADEQQRVISTIRRLF